MAKRKAKPAKAGEEALDMADYQALADFRHALRRFLKHHSTVELVDRLAELGLVRREPAADDRRKVTLRLTDKARRSLNSLSSAHLEELRRIRPAFAALLERLED
jgi:DNA-binding MarR family transcriptional regulator